MQAGLSSHGRRRVPGLRREEVAALAGVSTEYYAQLERGRVAGVSNGLLDAIAFALRLDEAERSHLYALARSVDAGSAPHRASPSGPEVRPMVRQILDGMPTMPALVANRRLDVLATNRLGGALFSPVFEDGASPANLSRFCFLEPQARTFFTHWDDAAHTVVALLRIEVGRHPDDDHLAELINELLARSTAFRDRWASHDVLLHRGGTKQFHHPSVGDLTLAFEVMDLGDPELTLTVYSAEPGGPAVAGLEALADWARAGDVGSSRPPPR